MDTHKVYDNTVDTDTVDTDTLDTDTVDCPSRNQAGVFATGERQNAKFAAFWFVFFTKKNVDYEIG